MSWLFCQLAEYYLALCEEDIDRLPAWVRRHLRRCLRCQEVKVAYSRTREAMLRYAQHLPDSPPHGWRPLSLRAEMKRRVLPWKLTLLPVATVAIVLAIFSLWERGTRPSGEVSTVPQLAREVPVAPPKALSQAGPPSPVAPPVTGNDKPQKEPSRQLAAPVVAKPAPAHLTPVVVRRPLEAPHTVIASQTAVQNDPHAGEDGGSQTTLEPLVPVQPVLAEAHPPVSPVQPPEAYVMQAAHPASTGGVE